MGLALVLKTFGYRRGTAAGSFAMADSGTSVPSTPSKELAATFSGAALRPAAIATPAPKTTARDRKVRRPTTPSGYITDGLSSTRIYQSIRNDNNTQGLGIGSRTRLSATAATEAVSRFQSATPTARDGKDGWGRTGSRTVPRNYLP
ncbi:hypothetical protein GCM10009825_22170 [Arthrobacter humicola]|uniref:Uncharacterized protein n=1 Tax=Arthrobacter humicola TaxID=409291 RepID=A0ABN2Z4Q0_9MICC